MGLLSRIISLITSAIIALQAATSLPVLSLNFKFDVGPAVFESGDNMYTVMWSTTRPGSGFVTCTKGDTEHTYYDQLNGNILTLDTIHAVRVPKASLDGSEYKINSQYVGAKLAYSAVKGKTISSDPIKFRGYAGESEINALLLPDIHDNAAPVKKAVAGFEKQPSFIVLNGDIMSEMVTKDDFISIINYANMFSGGEIPVVYVRGNHEPRGEFAPEMPRYFRTTTGGLYFTFNYGPLWSVVLDSGEDKEDSNPEYSGLVDFKTFLDDETAWLSGVEADDSTYKVCFVHKPSMDDMNGSKWLGMLSDIGIDAAVSGHLHRFDLHFYDGSVPFRRMVTGGQSDNNGYIATMLTFANGGIRALAFNEKGEQIADELF